MTGMNCCRCGQKFHYEKHNGICPKCAAYNRPQGQKPYDYNIEKDISAHYEKMDESHAKLHQMYDSASAHQPHKQHAEYHRRYDNNYKHPQQPQAQNGTPAYRGNQAQMPNGAPAYRAYQTQGQGGMPQGRAYQVQGQNGKNAPKGKDRKNMVVQIILIIFIINVVISLIQAFLG